MIIDTRPKVPWSINFYCLPIMLVVILPVLVAVFLRLSKQKSQTNVMFVATYQLVSIPEDRFLETQIVLRFTFMISSCIFGARDVKFDRTYIGFSHPLQLYIYISNSFVCCWSIRKSHVKSAFSSLKLTNLIANLCFNQPIPREQNPTHMRLQGLLKPLEVPYKWCLFQFHEARVFC